MGKEVFPTLFDQNSEPAEVPAVEVNFETRAASAAGMSASYAQSLNAKSKEPRELDVYEADSVGRRPTADEKADLEAALPSKDPGPRTFRIGSFDPHAGRPIRNDRELSAANKAEIRAHSRGTPTATMRETGKTAVKAVQASLTPAVPVPVKRTPSSPTIGALRRAKQPKR